MPKVQKKVNNADLPNAIGQTVAITSSTGTQKKCQVIAAGPDGKTVLVKSNREWFYLPTTFDSSQYLYTENEA